MKKTFDMNSENGNIMILVFFFHNCKAPRTIN